ncbi:MAG TPA: hypothetical protein VFZ23_00730 [Pyrinomonadaceae bacterium]
MTESGVVSGVDPAGSPVVPRAFQTIVYGGFAIGILDGLAATVNAGLRGVTPGRVFQYIASGVLGPSAFEGGIITVIAGVLLHFLVAFGVATVYYLLARTFGVVIHRAVICGLIYGVAVYFAMAYLIVPMSAVRQGPFSWTGIIVSIIIHMLFVGLPVALIAKRHATRS